jgi:hypothetical protein
MEKKISNSLSRVKNKQSDRDRIAEDIKKYLAEGGTIQKIPTGHSSETNGLRTRKQFNDTRFKEYTE